MLPPMLLDEKLYPPFTSPDWLFELKFDGWRLMAEFGAGRVELRTRGGTDCTKWFPEIAEHLVAYTGGPYVVDGEVCVLDEIGRSDFDRLQRRAAHRRRYPGCDPVTFCVFDVLIDAGVNVCQEPLWKRKQRLGKLLQPIPNRGLLYVQSIPTEGRALFQYVLSLKLEGLVAKRKDSIYQPGERSLDWKKIKRKGAVPAQRFRTKDKP